jgi:phospholipid/cholesterol/gamma-HCH transport system ATP-binding protein
MSSSDYTPSSTLLELSQVSFAYDERVILSDVSMHFPRGKVVAVMGGSGSGKTTILRLIGGLLKAQHGNIQFDGIALHEAGRETWMQARRRMGLLFQFGALFTDLSCFDNVAFPLREHTSLPEDLLRDLVMMKLHAVGLRGASHLKPAEISGGMARRVALARAIALDPQLIMYDEPFAGLDPISMGITANLIRRLNDALGATSIVVSHDVHETFLISDFVYFIANAGAKHSGWPGCRCAHVCAPVSPCGRFVETSPAGGRAGTFFRQLFPGHHSGVWPVRRFCAGAARLLHPEPLWRVRVTGFAGRVVTGT